MWPICSEIASASLGRHIREDPRNFVAIAALSGTTSRTCAQMTSGTRLRAPGLPGCRATGPTSSACYRDRRRSGAKTPLYAPDRRRLTAVDAALRADLAAWRGRPSAQLTSPEMADFGDAPLIGPGSELQLTIDGQAVAHDEVLAEVELRARAGARATPTGKVAEGLESANLYAVAEQLAARAATPSTRRQYAAIYRSFA